MPSKWVRTASVSVMSATMGWVEGSWSCASAQVFSSFANVTQALVNRVARASESVAM